VYRRILGPVYDNEKENKRILTNKDICARDNPLNAKLNPICHLLAFFGAHHILHIRSPYKPTTIETIRLNRLRWFGHVQRTTRLRDRPRNRWQDEVRDDGRAVGVEGWQEKVHNREEWKKILRTARNHRILHMPME
jgi:hypothetical protein